MVTTKDVAEVAKVSVSTVGRALADDPRISEQTKTRVKQVATQLGYVENLPARLMRGGRSNLIGLMLPDIRNAFYATIAEALSDCCSAKGHQLALSLANDPQTEARHIKELVSARAAGMVIVPSVHPTRESLALLKNLPHVQLLRRAASIGAASFGINDEASIHEGTRHLLELGHRRIAYVGGTEELSTGRDRVAGYRRAMREFGIGADQMIEILGPASSPEFGTQAIADLLASPDRPTAVLVSTVRITQAILEYLHERGMASPETLSVVGFGDSPEFKWWGPGLTTLRMPIEELATSCALWLFHQLEVGATTDPKYHSTVPATLIVRGSTAPCVSP
ncbi:hypothetical protein ATO6_20605 [Oceanicola sp. 22II-s10i]|nr:hypothetical protein ATO6_20605 [Oceanicola sp. 22II-s10i]